jgi:hypothetical protein
MDVLKELAGVEGSNKEAALWLVDCALSFNAIGGYKKTLR